MGPIRKTSSIAILSLLIGGTGAIAQTADEQMRQEIEALKAGQDQIRKDLAEIKRLLQTRPTGQRSGPNVKDKVFDIGDNPVRGERTAKITLVEFTDYQ